MPFPFIRQIQSTASAAPTSTFFGSHPRRAQVPPNGLDSTIATCHPASRHRDATVEAADPVPIAIRSNFLVIVPSRHSAYVHAPVPEPQRFTPGHGKLVSNNVVTSYRCCSLCRTVDHPSPQPPGVEV